MKFYKWYRISLLIGNGAWRTLFFCLLPSASLRNSAHVAVLLLWASVPYLLLLWLVSLIRTRWVLIGTTIAVLGTDVQAGLSMLHPMRSTAAMAALFVPLWQIIFILPAGIGLDWIYRWGYRGFPIRRRSSNCLDDDLDDDEVEEEKHD